MFLHFFAITHLFFYGFKLYFFPLILPTFTLTPLHLLQSPLDLCVHVIQLSWILEFC